MAHLIHLFDPLAPSDPAGFRIMEVVLSEAAVPSVEVGVMSWCSLAVAALTAWCILMVPSHLHVLWFVLLVGG